jgi:hypothetical protein
VTEMAGAERDEVWARIERYLARFCVDLGRVSVISRVPAFQRRWVEELIREIENEEVGRTQFEMDDVVTADLVFISP